MRKIIFFIVIIIVGCGKDKIHDPSAAILSFPAQNSLCVSGAILSTTESNIVFSWAQSDYTTSYELKIKDLLTGTTTSQVYSTNEATVTLKRNNPYTWSVISKSDKTANTAQSETWKFYNAGPGATSYAPFPATIVSPQYSQLVTSTGGTINLSWTGSDVENDIINYDVYFGTAAVPPLLRSNVTDLFANGVAVSTNTTYHWKVITRDAKGNTSDTGIFQFKVN